MSARAWPWVLGGGAAAVAAYYWTRPTSSSSLPGRWVWPVGVWQGRRPQISDGYHSHRTVDGNVVEHGGVDLMYTRRPADAYTVGSPNGTRGFVMPDARPALAAADGVVWFAAQTPRGWSVILDHSPRKLATYYTHLSSLLVTSKQRIGVGEPLGIIGADPMDAAHLKHLHFETWRGASSARFDPQPFMRDWEYLPDPITPASGALVARNARARRIRRGAQPAMAAHVTRRSVVQRSPERT